MQKQLWTGVVVLSMFAWGAVASAQEQARDFSANSARTHRAPRGGFLTPPSSAPRVDIVMDFLRDQGHTNETANSLILESENFVSRTGITHARLRQQVAGLEVYGTYVRSSMTADGRLVSVVENLAPITSASIVPAQISQAQAFQSVADEFYPNLTGDFPEIGTTGNTTEFDGGDFFFENPTATRVAVPMANGAIHVGYLVTTWDDQDNMLRHTVVGRTGRILVVETRTSADTYLIFTDNPVSTPQDPVDPVPVSGPGTGNDESLKGWVFTDTDSDCNLNSNCEPNRTQGNNVNAYLDSDDDDFGQEGDYPAQSLTHDFVTGWNGIDDPWTTDNQAVAVTNLFYFNNVIHDRLYKAGFTESAGNFQETNFADGGSGGAGSDSVLAEAQDGSGTNNANFATPDDGENPRMQMYLWTLTNPLRDGDLDSDIIWHEYGHGVTWRMVGNMSGPLARAIGEGFGDVLAIYANRLTDTTAAVAEYSYNNLGSIRVSQRYFGFRGFS